MKLESVELQEPVEEWMYRKSEPPYQIGDEAYPLPFVGIWGSLRLIHLGRWPARLEPGP